MLARADVDGGVVTVMMQVLVTSVWITSTTVCVLRAATH